MLVVPPRVTPVAVLVPRLSAPLIESTKGVVMLVLALPVPDMRKLAVWSAEFWLRIALPSAPAYCQVAPPLVLLQTSVAVAPGDSVEPSKVKLAVPMLARYRTLP